MSLLAPLGDTPLSRNDIRMGPFKAPKGTNTNVTSAKGHFCAYPRHINNYGIDQTNSGTSCKTRSVCQLRVIFRSLKPSYVNSFQTTLTPNPEKSYKYYPAIKQHKTCVLNVLFKCFQLPVSAVWQSFTTAATPVASMTSPVAL